MHCLILFFLFRAQKFVQYHMLLENSSNSIVWRTRHLQGDNALIPNLSRLVTFLTTALQENGQKG